MRIQKSDSRVIYKKLKYLLKSLFIDLELVKFLSHRQLYKLLYRTTKFNSKFNYSKHELKILTRQIIEFNFSKHKTKDTTLVQDFISYVVTIFKKPIEKLVLKSIEKPFTTFFIDEHPISLE